MRQLGMAVRVRVLVLAQTGLCWSKGHKCRVNVRRRKCQEFIHAMESASLLFWSGFSVRQQNEERALVLGRAWLACAPSQHVFCMWMW